LPIPGPSFATSISYSLFAVNLPLGGMIRIKSRAAEKFNPNVSACEMLGYHAFLDFLISKNITNPRIKALLQAHISK
jgi:hypothetical protein